MKCVLQIPAPIEKPEARSQIGPCLWAWTRCSSLRATAQEIQQMQAASATTQAVCSSVRQAKARYIEVPRPSAMAGTVTCGY